MEVRKDGTVLIEGQLLPTHDEDPIPLLHERLRSIREELPSETFYEQETLGPPVIVIADAETPFAKVAPLLQVLGYRSIEFLRVVLAVRSAQDGVLMGIDLRLPDYRGTQCYSSPATATRLAWSSGALNPNAEEDAPAAFLVARVDTYLPGYDKEPAPVYSRAEPRRGEDLLPWLHSAAQKHPVLLLEAQQTATWQDFVSLLDLAIEAEFDQVGDYLLGPTIDTWASSSR